ncbi:MAG: hypothetical protein MR006_00945 [Arcanobacterium sp.]|nr:hypothetical protein [Arcanobacterium sp.]MDY5589179.1 hypothetical protein [Arcanobacterium sp.]
MPHCTQKMRDLIESGLAGLGTFAYYATPDILASRAARFAAKATVLSGLGAVITFFHREEIEAAGKNFEGAKQENGNSTVENCAFTPEKIVMIAGLATFSLALNVLQERAIYRHAEKAKANGRSFAHTKQALIFGALTAGLMYATQTADRAPADSTEET